MAFFASMQTDSNWEQRLVNFAFFWCWHYSELTCSQFENTTRTTQKHKAINIT